MIERNVTIMGIGNLLWADEGFGVRTIETLHRRYRFADHVRLIDGGTQGIYLVQHVQAADILVVFDAIDYGLAPGTLKSIEGADVPSFMGAKKMSLHQTGFQEVLAMAELLGDYPQHILLVGVQPEQLEDYGGSLRPSVRAQIDPAIDAALAWLAARGVTAERRRSPLSVAQALHPEQLALAAYETQRPTAELACRLGDERVLRDDRIAFDPKPLDLGARPLRVDVDKRGRG
ncbi:MAG: HyaD/HybD family hydrogenase maturation endopeptidase [Gammaproteobacteria bacterium]|nr:HyaD/HybD family hydrogenase maturation endopeptidase [Gammaproteobacteria bacterium]